MKSTKTLVILVLTLIICSAEVAKAVSMGTAFTYQGFLTDAKSGSPKPADGLYDFQFLLYDDPNGGIQQGYTIDINDLDVIDGYFMVELDFGNDIFTGEARWLETVVRRGTSNDPCDFTKLSPRQELTLTPYAVYATKAGAVLGGTANYISKFLQVNKLGNSVMYESNSNIGIGTTSPEAKLDVDGDIAASGGDSNNWNAVYGWGNHAWAGYLTTESDPKIGPISNNFVPKWNGSALVTGTIYDNGNVGIGTTNPGTNKLEVVGGPIKATGGLIIETRTSDPANPVTGQIWLRTDL